VVVLGPDPARLDARVSQPLRLLAAGNPQVLVERHRNEKALRTFGAAAYFAQLFTLATFALRAGANLSTKSGSRFAPSRSDLAAELHMAHGSTWKQ